MSIRGLLSMPRPIWGRSLRARDGLILCILGPLLPAMAAAVCTPTVQWTWQGSVRLPSHPHIVGTPLVVHLRDTNGNGRVDANDIPDVVFTAYAVVPTPGGGTEPSLIVAVDGATGSTLFVIGDTPGTFPINPHSLTAADVDGDGIVDLVGIEADFRQLVAYDNSGSLKWVGGLIDFMGIHDTVGTADIDQDGAPEFFTGKLCSGGIPCFAVFGEGGSFRWQGTAGIGKMESPEADVAVSAVDLDPSSPGLELLAGNTVYRSNGAILWTNSSLPDGWTAAGDFYGDGKAEVVLVTADWPGAPPGTPGEVRLLSGVDGTPLGPPYTLSPFVVPPPLGNWFDAPAQPVIADVDGDGRSEVIVANRGAIDCLGWSGASFVLKWRQPIVEDRFLRAGPVAYDFDGDGAAELVFHDNEKRVILDGSTGAVLYSTPFPGGITAAMPVVADIDNDCRTEILIAGTDWFTGEGWLIAYKCAENNVVPARAAWNQFQYHVTNVNDDGTIPRFEQPPWAGGKGWIAQERRREQRAVAAAGADIRICEGGTAKLDATATLPGTCAAEVEYRWLYSATVACAWSFSPTCDVAPGATTVYTLETRCFAAPACAAVMDSDTVAVEVFPDIVPPGVGNTLRAVKSIPDLLLSWGALAEAATYTLNRGTQKGVWPAPPFLPGLAGTTTTISDLPPPPDLYYYRVSGASCSGKEGP